MQGKKDRRVRRNGNGDQHEEALTVARGTFTRFAFGWMMPLRLMNLG
jgi:hypothetical protein